jgi:hypothetical protein
MEEEISGDIFPTFLDQGNIQYLFEVTKKIVFLRNYVIKIYLDGSLGKKNRRRQKNEQASPTH